MPTCPVRSMASSTASTKRADLLGPLGCRRRRAPRPGGRRARGCRARTASSKSWQTYAMRSAHATTSPSGVDGAGRRQEWLRTPSSVSAAQVERRERDVGAVDGVVVAGPGQVRRERLLRRVPGRAVPAVVGERDRLHQREAQVGGPGDAGGDLGHLDRVREAGAEMVVLGRDEHLALAGEAPPRPRVLHPVEVALEAQAVRVGLLGPGPVARADRTGRARRQQRRRARPRAPRGTRTPTARRTRARPRARAGRAGPAIQRAVAIAVRELTRTMKPPRVRQCTRTARRQAVVPGPPAPRAAWAAARRAMGTR